jgi:transcriptional regulator with XRE-family HTH domain
LNSGNVKNYIDNKRKERGLMVKDIMKLLGISRRTYNSILTGERNIVRHIYNLSKALNVTTDEIFFILDSAKCTKNNEEE